MQTPGGQTEAAFFDGESAERHKVLVSVHRPHPPLLIIEGDAPGLPLHWPLDQLRGLSDQADRNTLVVTRLAETEDEAPRDPARLVITDPILRNWIRNSRPNLFRKDVASGTTSRLLVRAGAALAAVFIVIFLILPRMADTLATLIPEEREAALGAATLKQFEYLFGDDETSMRCENVEAQAVWDGLAGRIKSAASYDGPLKVIIYDHPMVNAFAVPGGHVVFFRGMIEEAETPDELTSVLAHEIGHVVARDPTRLALRSAGSVGILGLLFGDFAGGGLALFLAEQFISASYSQDAEEAADAFAFETMVALNMDATALGTLFARLRDEHGDIDGVLSHFISHPSFESRIEAANDAGARLSDPTPALTDEEFEILKTGCEA